MGKIIHSLCTKGSIGIVDTAVITVPIGESYSHQLVNLSLLPSTVLIGSIDTTVTTVPKVVLGIDATHQVLAIIIWHELSDEDRHALVDIHVISKSFLFSRHRCDVFVAAGWHHINI